MESDEILIMILALIAYFLGYITCVVNVWIMLREKGDKDVKKQVEQAE